MILVTGATGRIGDQVVRALRNLGLDVRALVRKGSYYYWLNDTGCNFFFGDLRDPVTLSRACRDIDYMVVCSGVSLETRDNNHTTVTVDGHKTLFEAARKRGIKRVVFVSCMGVDRGLSVPSFDARKGAEQLLLDSGLDYTILRSCVTEHLFMDLAYRVIDNGSVVLPGAGDNKLNPLPTRDLALMAAASLDLDAVRNQTVEVGGGVEMTARDAFELACDVIGAPPTARNLPGPALALGRRMGRPLRRYAHRLAERHAWFSEDLTIDPARIQDTFGFELTGLREAMVESNKVMTVMRDPDLREKRMVHPQFYATVYEPGSAPLKEMPAGPRPPQD